MKSHQINGSQARYHCFFECNVVHVAHIGYAWSNGATAVWTLSVPGKYKVLGVLGLFKRWRHIPEAVATHRRYNLSKIEH